MNQIRLVTIPRQHSIAHSPWVMSASEAAQAPRVLTPAVQAYITSRRFDFRNPPCAETQPIHQRPRFRGCPVYRVRSTRGTTCPSSGRASSSDSPEVPGPTTRLAQPRFAETTETPTENMSKSGGSSWEFLRAVGFHRGVLVQPVSLRGPRAGPTGSPKYRLHGRAEHVRHGTRARRGMEHAPTPNRTPAPGNRSMSKNNNFRYPPSK